MADIDEEAIILPSTSQDTTHADHDLSDETQDFRFLNNLSMYIHPAIIYLPISGTLSLTLS